MDDFGIVYIIENAQQFWSELEDILHIPKDANLGQLDTTLARFVTLCTNYHEQYLQTHIQLEHACSLLLESELFSFHSERMRELLLEEAEKTTDPHAQLIVYQILLQYGRMHSSFLRSHKKWKPLLPLLMDHVLLDFEPEVEDLATSGNWNKAMPVPIEANLRIHSVQILYEVCRVQKFSLSDLRIFDDGFTDYIFELVEQTRHMQDETLNYSLIKLIIALNEQFMVATMSSSPTTTTAAQASKQPSSEESNRILRVLMTRLNSSKTFGENMIFMLNRAGRSPEDLCMQLLILKILYLLFTTNGTSEYFYTNDLRVLVDVFLRELVDLDEDSESLKHTYLRVLHPLLTRTQLRDVPYKRSQIVRTLEGLIGHSSIRDINPTTKRLVERCLSGDWCVQLRRIDSPASDSSGLLFSMLGRVDSPGVDSVTSATRSEFEVSQTQDMPRDIKRDRSQSHSHPLKSSRSAGNLRHAAQSSKGGRKINAVTGLIKQQSDSESAYSLNELSKALPPSTTVPTSPSSMIASSSKPPRSSTLPDAHAHSSSSLDQPSESITPISSSYSKRIHSTDAHADSLGTVVDSLVAPSPLRPSHGRKISSQSQSSSSGSIHSGSRSDHDRNASSSSSMMKTRRAAPSPPQKRRRPPAIPVVTATSAGGSTIVTIATSHPHSHQSATPSRSGVGSPLRHAAQR